MSATFPYWKKLLNPRWQRRRLEILKRDGFSCRCCGDSESTLHVHHRFYTKGLEPWEYEDRSLVSVCADCHKEIAEVDALILSVLDPRDISFFYDLASVIDESRRKGLKLGDLISACREVVREAEAGL